MSSEIDNFFNTLKGGGNTPQKVVQPTGGVSDVDSYFNTLKSSIPKPAAPAPIKTPEPTLWDKTKQFVTKGLTTGYGPVPGLVGFGGPMQLSTGLDKATAPIIEKVTSIPAVQKPLVALAERTSGTGIASMLYAGMDPNKTFRQVYDKAKQSQAQDPSKLNQFMYQLVDSAPQTALGVALNFAPGGKALSTAYWTGISAADQIQNKGKVTSLGNIAIDVIGDRLLGSSLESLFKKPATTLVSTMVKSGITEGGTEVAQDMLKYANDYKNAKTPAERAKILADAKKYITSGQILMTAGVGGLTGAGIGAGANVMGGGQQQVGIQNKDEVRVSPEAMPGTEQIPGNIQPVVPGTELAPGTVQTPITPAPTFATPNQPVVPGTAVQQPAQQNATPEIAQFFDNLKKTAPVATPQQVVPEVNFVKTAMPEQKIPTAQEIANEMVMAKQNVGEAAKTSYRSAHQLALENSVESSSLDMVKVKEKIKELNGYISNRTISDIKKLEKIQGNPEAEVTIYRASPVNELNDGDWVTTNREYANNIKEQNGGKVYTYKVKAKDLRYPNDIESLPSLARAAAFSYSPKTTTELQQKKPATEIPVKEEKLLKPKVNKEEVARLEQALREDYVGNEKIVEELYKLYTRLEISEAGSRVMTEHVKKGVGNVVEFHGVRSTFPQWIPEKFRSMALFKKVMPALEDIEKLKYPEGNRPAQREFFNLLLDELDSQLGTDTSVIRGKILEQYGESKTNRQETNDLVAQSIERGESPSDAEIEANVDEYLKSVEEGTLK
jgi:hypothetical protein